MAVLIHMVARLFILGLVGWSLAGRAQMPKPIEVHSVGYGYYNAYLLVSATHAILIDTGLPDKVDKLEKNIRKAGVAPERISLIILTHAHADHAGGTAWFQEQYQVPVVLHASALETAQRGKIDKLKIGTPKARLAKFVRRRAHRHFPPFRPDIVMQQDTLRLDSYGIDGQIVSVAGHTPGSVIVCLEGMVFAGDLIRGGLLPFCRKRPAYHFFAEEKQVVYRTLLRLLQEGYATWYVGHGGPLEPTAVRELLRRRPL